MPENRYSPRIAEHTWDLHKAIILHLYCSENKPLTAPGGVQDTLNSQYGFFATKAQYETKLRKWRVHKYGAAYDRRRQASVLNDWEVDGLNMEWHFIAPDNSPRSLAIRTSSSQHHNLPPARISPRAPSIVPSTSSSLWHDISSVSMTSVTLPSPVSRRGAGSLFPQNHKLHQHATSSVYGVCDSAWSVLDNFPSRTTDLLSDLAIPDFATSMVPVILRLFPKASSSGHIILLGDNTAVDDAISGMSQPGALHLVRGLSIDHQLIYMVMNHLINHDDVARTLNHPETELEQLLNTGIMYCFSLGPHFISSVIRYTPSPYGRSLTQSVFRAALFLGNGPILNVILENDRGNLANQSILVGGTHYYPLEYTSYSGLVEATEALLRHGGDLNMAWDFHFSDCEPGHQIMRLLMKHELKVELNSAVVHMEDCSMDGLKLLVTCCLDRSFETFFDHQALLIILLRRDWDDSLPDTLKTIIERASPDGHTHQKLWSSVLSEALSVAILRSHASSVDILLEMGAQPNVNCLVSAVLSNNLRVFETLLDLGLDPNAQQSNPFLEAGHDYYRQFTKGLKKQDLIHTALSESIKHRTRGAFQILQARGFISKLAHQPAAFVSAFIAACETGDNRLIKQLLQLQSMPRRLENIGEALEAALREDQHHLIEELLSLGIRPSLECLCLAVQSRQVDSVELLTSCMDLSGIIRDHFGYYDNAIIFEALSWGDQTAIDCVLRSGHPVNVFIRPAFDRFHDWKLDLRPPGRDEHWNMTPLSAAIVKRNSAAVKALIAYGARLLLPHQFNSRYTSHQSTPIASRHPDLVGDGWTLTPLAAAAVTGDLPLIEEFLRLGADPFDNSAFFVCIMRDFENAITLILSAFKTRYPDGVHSFGSDALYQIIRRKDMRLLRVLAMDTDITGPVKEGYRTILDTTGRTRVWVSFTSPLGEALRFCSEKDDTGEVIDILLPLVKDHNTVVHQDYKLGNMTSLLYAISLGSLKIVQRLQDAGANISLPAEVRITRTPLQAAAQAESKEIVEYLLDQGVSPNEPPAVRAGATALQLAAITGNINIATILLKAGANVNAPPALLDGRTAFEGATEHGRIEMMIFLVGQGADLLANGNTQYQRAVAFAEDNLQYAAKAVADELYAKVFASQGPSYINMGEEWPGPDIPDFETLFP